MSVSAQEFIDKWPSAVVGREEVAKATGGLKSPKSMANLDSRGEGPPERVKLGRKVGYPAASFFQWLVEQLQPVEGKKRGVQ